MGGWGDRVRIGRAGAQNKSFASIERLKKKKKK
jgi:hypothetical protein